MKKGLILIFVMVVIGFSSVVRGEVSLASNARGACLIESQSGEVLYAKEENFRLSPASMTKIMTLTLIYDYITKNNIPKTTMVTASSHAKSMGGSQVFLEDGEALSIDDMLKCICIASANDCAVAMAEFVAGTEEAFVQLMNEKAAQLGLRNTNFCDSTGLTTKNHYSSAYDMAIMSRLLILEYPDVLNYTNIREDYIRKDTDNPFWLVNTNRLIGKANGVDGLKTGWTVEAGYCLSSTKKIDNMRLISVVMGYSDAKIRNAESVELLNYGFATYELKLLYPKGENVLIIDNFLYKPAKLHFTFQEDIYVLKKKNEDLKNFSYTITQEPDLDNKENGYATIYYGNEEYQVVPLSIGEEYKRKSFWELLTTLFQNSFGK